MAWKISQDLSQVGESFNALGTREYDSSLIRQAKNPDLGLASSSSLSQDLVENERVEHERADDESSIDWTDSEEEEEVVPFVQQETEPSVQEEVEPTVHENAEHDIDNDGEDFDQSVDYGSNVHEELRIVKEDVRKFNRENRRNKKKEKTKGFLGEVGLDEGYEGIEKGKKNFKSNLIEDEPYYDSSDCDNYQSDDDLLPVSNDELEGGSLRGRKKSNRVIYNSTCDVVIWQCWLVFESVKEFREAVTKYVIKKGVELDKYVNESTRVRVKCKSGCPWLLYAIKEGRSENFTIKTYNPRHKCTRTNTNFLCNSKFLSKYLKDRIISQPRIKGWEIQDWVRKELKVYVGKTVCLKTRKLVLQEIIEDHVAEFNRILDYRDVFLQTNPGSICVVKLAYSDNGMKQFHSFYICFDAMKRGFQQGCGRCIGLDGCCLKEICKGQLLIAVAKDGNNQMFPIAWAVVGTESKDTWRWFMTILQDDLNLGDGSRVNIISDMQKGLVAVADEVFPECVLGTYYLIGHKTGEA
ncbi:uncharacterized protein LOC129905025 [Solanum dulcamara]|uniref:uncharacterized protein LOC129905025 n=1 Tax=Solanum dulcamara TaxID=45834 RepID=UPI00248614AA|nr:uncharacterized protein LOC129905025 [Solanum dulcamara]